MVNADQARKAHRVSADDLAKMSPDTLRDYIEKRLRKQELDPPAPAAQGIEPEDFFLSTFRKIKDEDFRRRFGEQVERLLFNAGLKDAEYISHLFRTVELLDLYEAVSALYFLLVKRTELEGLKDHFDQNLFAGLLRLMVRFEQGEGDLQIKWENFLGHPDYAPIAFNALIRIDPSRALVNLVEFTDTALKHPARINYHLLITKLIDRADADDISGLCAALAHNDDIARETRAKIFGSFGCNEKTRDLPAFKKPTGKSNTCNSEQPPTMDNVSKASGPDPADLGQRDQPAVRGTGVRCPFLTGRQLWLCGAFKLVLDAKEVQMKCSNISYHDCKLYRQRIAGSGSGLTPFYIEDRLDWLRRR